MGHDLWSYDESDEFEIWAPDYTRATCGIIVTFFYTGGCTVEWVDWRT